jgi:hypothetical protein
MVQYNRKHKEFKEALSLKANFNSSKFYANTFNKRFSWERKNYRYSNRLQSINGRRFESGRYYQRPGN